MSIKIKFIVASDAAIQILQDLVITRLHEKFAGVLSEELLSEYAEHTYNSHSLTLLLNDFSNKCLLVFVDEKPAGYAIFSSVPHNLPIKGLKRATRIIDLEVLDAFKGSGAKQDLFERCLAQCEHGDAVWIQEIPEDDVLEFYAKKGFTQKEKLENLGELPVASTYLIKEK